MKSRLKLKTLDHFVQLEEIKLVLISLPLRDRIKEYVLKGFAPDVVARFEYDKFMAVTRSLDDLNGDDFLSLVWRVLDEL